MYEGKQQIKHNFLTFYIYLEFFSSKIINESKNYNKIFFKMLSILVNMNAWLIKIAF